MNLLRDTLDPLGSVVGALVALLTGTVAVVGYLRARAARRWWPVLVPLLESQKDDALGHPYRFAGGYVRPLSEVYVPRRAVRRADPGGAAVAADPLLGDPGEGLTAGPGHVLLIGEPGSGKSALVRQASATSARHWLAVRGRVRRSPDGWPVVVALPAGALVGQQLPAALAEAYPMSDLDFTRPPAPGRRWLVCVDGVDAVADPAERTEVLNRLAALAGPGPTAAMPWRLLVTSRQLAETELAVLCRGYTAYHLTPFSPADVRRFAYRWFARGPGAAAFLAWVDAERATTAVRNPLTATVAAVVWETGPPGASPPPDPAALLDRFVGALLEAGRASVDLAAEALRHAPRGRPVADWLAGRHTELVEVAAVAALAGADPVEAVVTWSAGHAPDPPERVLPDWPRHVLLILLATGLFSAAETGPGRPDTGGRTRLAPTWPGPLEYLAAGPLARDWHPDRWIAAMTTTSRRGLGLYAIGRGSAPPDFLQQVAEDPAGAIAAGHYLAAGGTTDPAVRADVLAALLAHWSAGHTSGDPAPPGAATQEIRDVPGECHALLTTLAAARTDRDLLRAIAVDPRRTTAVRRAVALFFAARRRARPATVA